MWRGRAPRIGAVGQGLKSSSRTNRWADRKKPATAGHLSIGPLPSCSAGGGWPMAWGMERMPFHGPSLRKRTWFDSHASHVVTIPRAQSRRRGRLPFLDPSRGPRQLRLLLCVVLLLAAPAAPPPFVQSAAAAGPKSGTTRDCQSRSATSDSRSRKAHGHRRIGRTTSHKRTSRGATPATSHTRHRPACVHQASSRLRTRSSGRAGSTSRPSPISPVVSSPSAGTVTLPLAGVGLVESADGTLGSPRRVKSRGGSTEGSKLEEGQVGSTEGPELEESQVGSTEGPELEESPVGSNESAKPIENPLGTVPLSIMVRGNNLVDGNGQIVTLHGANIEGTEWSCLYGNALPTRGVEESVTAMAAWHINAVRIPLNEDCWLGINGAPTNITAYHEAIRSYVNLLHAHGLYAILDLHWSAPGSTLAHLGPGFEGYFEMADEEHSLAFWESVAAYFYSDHAVLFDLFNEPFGISWSCWREGCIAPRGFQAAGMQQLIDAVRKTGATQPVMVGGPNQESRLGKEWLANRPSDPAHQLVAAAHLYGYHPTGLLNNIDSVAEQFPVVIGEMGETNCADNEIENLLEWANAHKVSYLAWAWSTGECTSELSLISSYGGTPTNYGLGYREQLREDFSEPTP